MVVQHVGTGDGTALHHRERRRFHLPHRRIIYRRYVDRELVGEGEKALFACAVDGEILAPGPVIFDTSERDECAVQYSFYPAFLNFICYLVRKGTGGGVDLFEVHPQIDRVLGSGILGKVYIRYRLR